MMKPPFTIQATLAAFALAAFAFAAPAAAADKIDPVADAKAFKKFFTDKFPKLKPEILSKVPIR